MLSSCKISKIDFLYARPSILQKSFKILQGWKNNSSSFDQCSYNQTKCSMEDWSKGWSSRISVYSSALTAQKVQLDSSSKGHQFIAFDWNLTQSQTIVPPPHPFNISSAPVYEVWSTASFVLYHRCKHPTTLSGLLAHCEYTVLDKYILFISYSLHLVRIMNQRSIFPVQSLNASSSTSKISVWFFQLFPGPGTAILNERCTPLLDTSPSLCYFLCLKWFSFLFLRPALTCPGVTV